MKNEQLAEIVQSLNKLDVALNAVKSQTYKSAARTKLQVMLLKSEALRKDLERKVKNERK